MKVLIAEDESDTLQLLSLYFSSRGHDVLCATHGPQAWELFGSDSPDLVLLDIHMPGMSGWEIIERIRREGDTPIIVVSALDSPQHAVQGLDLGADDYLRKPFDLSELDSRVRAVMRRTASQPAAPAVRSGPIRIDDRAKQVWIAGQPVRLTPREYRLLKLLTDSPNTVFSQQQILDCVWSGNERADNMDVKQYVYLLRSKIEENPREPRLVQTVKGFGYQYVPD
jgi:DNA-binding response OmpR family regulator